MPAQAIATCQDGTQIPFEWVYDDAPDYEWMLEREHWPGAMTPMERWIWLNGMAGADRAWAELDLPPVPSFIRFQLAGPFLYARVTMPSPAQIAAMMPRYLAVNAEFGGALNFWKSYCEPRIIRACDDMAEMPADADARTVAETMFYGFHQTFTCLALLFLPNIQLTAMLEQHGVPDAALTAFEVTQGGGNASQAIDEEIWELAELARGSDAVSAILRDSGPGALDRLRAEPAAAEFLAAFDKLIAQHGRRSQGWALTAETWRERPDAALSLVAAQVASECVSPAELRERTSRRRQEAIERVLAHVPAERHAEFDAILKALDSYVNIREGRAYWQLVLSGESRGWLLRLGETLVHAGRIDAAADVLLLTPDEIDGEGDIRARVSAARDELARWSTLEPPHTIGTPGEIAAQAAAREPLRGTAASRGQVTGVVRILQQPEEGGRLQRGDILVTRMTTPAWTPLFAIAGGIVTETGGALSHPAITAREYGIPAVVALAGATTTLADGDTITVDGTAGTITKH